MELTIEQVEALLKAMKTHNRNATVDWTNRQIMVLSEHKKDMKHIMPSTGKPVIYQDYLFTLP